MTIAFITDAPTVRDILSVRLRESAMLVEQVRDRLEAEAKGNSGGPP